jgi:hypothetical protein
MLAESKAKVPNWLMFFPAENCLKLKPLNPVMAAVPATSVALPAVSPDTPLKATSPPGSLSEKPECILMGTVTRSVPVSLTVTVPTEPGKLMLFEVRSKVKESTRRVLELIIITLGPRSDPSVGDGNRVHHSMHGPAFVKRSLPIQCSNGAIVTNFG